MFTRHAQNPLIQPWQLQPSRPDFEVIGTFNAGVAVHNDDVVLLVRVAERPRYDPNGSVLCPHISAQGELVIESITPDDERYDTRDPRLVHNVKTGEILLTSMSHLRLARSRDGINFVFDEHPWMVPTSIDEGFGIEDARITQIGDTYYINYSAVSRYGIATGLLSTRDFVDVERHGIIFPPANRDVTLFPQKINDCYVCYHRPMPAMLGGLNIWMATSPNLKHWGGHQLVLEAKHDGWESGRVGGGAPPLYTQYGWLNIYHAADRHNRYCLGAFLTPHDDPARVIAYSPQPILSPEADYETNGFFPNVVFTCGAILNGDTLSLYYGASDECVAVAHASLKEIIPHLV